MVQETKTGTIRVLHLEDNEIDHLLVRSMMESDGLACEFVAVQTRVDFESALVSNQFDLIISDYTLPSFDGLSGLFLARQLAPRTPFIFFSGTIGEESAVESLKKGASDYVIKYRPRRLVPAIRSALKIAAEQARLQESQERNREQAALLDKARDGILVCDLNNRVVYWNQGAERIYGWPTGEALGQDITQLLFQGQPPAQLGESLKNINERGEWVGELEEFTKDGRAIVVQVRATLIRDETGKPKSLLLINTDVTESRQLEEKFLRAQRMESLGVLVSGIAHDLNNALSPILVGIDIVRSDGRSDESVLSMMEKSARHGAEMVKQILAFARGNDTMKVPMDVGQILREVGKIIEGTFSKTVHCRVKLEEDLRPVAIFATQIYQVVMNLCINAKDAMPKGGTLTLAAQNVRVTPELAAKHPGARPGDHLCVSVADTGSGIPPGQLEKIFEPFFTTKPAGKGTGLGLSTSRDIIRKHGGFMTVSSRVNEGSEFKFYLPADAGRRPAAAPDGSLPPADKSPLPSGNGERILVVDDEATVVALAHTALENFGYRVKTAINTWEALACMDDKQEDFQLVIVDLHMEFMGTLTTALAMRKASSQIKMIVTGAAEKDVPANLREQLKADAFVSKPITMETLLKTINEVLGRKPGRV